MSAAPVHGGLGAPLEAAMAATPRLARRRLLQGALLGAASSTLGLNAWASTPAPTAGVGLDQAKWAPRNHALVAALIARHGNTSASYSAQRRPYAVFDWDNTSIMNDCEEALLMYQINQLAFKLSPEEFAAITRQNVPPGPFVADYKNANGQVLDLESVCADLDADYRYLHAHYRGLAGSQSLEEVRASAQFEDFRAKLYFLYEAVNDTHGVAVGYPWVIYFLANMTVAEVRALAQQSNDLNLGLGLSKLKFSSPASLPGRAGVVTVGHFQGIRLCTEVATLMDALRQHGMDVYVSTASLEDVVAEFACNPKYGYHVARENVLGLRLEQDGERLRNAYRKGWPLNWGPGKSEVIRRELVARKGYGPVLVAGDSDGDYDMLRDFADTELGLIVNRLKKGKIGELSQQAAASLQAARPRFALQGRFEATGNWLPGEATLKLGKTATALLA